MDKLLTQKELAERWQISERWVEKLRQTGKGPAFVALGEAPKLKTIRYRLADVEAYEQSRRKCPAKWREFIEVCAGFAGKMVSGNDLSRKAKELLTEGAE